MSPRSPAGARASEELVDAPPPDKARKRLLACRKALWDL